MNITWKTRRRALSPLLGIAAMGLFFAAGLFLSACDTATPPAVVPPAPDGVVARIDGGAATLLLDDAKMQRLFTTSFDLDDAKQSELNTYLDTQGPTPYLIGRTKDADGNCVSMAIELATTEDMRYATMSGTTHKCAGEPCSYCSFKKDENDAIVGCNACGDFIGGRCNHTVEDEVDGPN